MIRISLIFLAMLLNALAFAQSSQLAFVPQPRHPGPSGNQDMVMRLEKHRTCECPWYEVRIFPDGATMFWGKEAVEFLGVDGSYMLPVPRARPDVPPKLTALLAKAKQVFDSTEHSAFANANLSHVLREKSNGTRQVIEIELNLGDKSRKRIFSDGDHAELRQLASEIEYLYTIEQYAPRLKTAITPRPKKFADPNMLVHWRTYDYTRNQCPYSSGLDELNVTLYRSGRYQAEASRAFWKPVDQSDERLKSEGHLDEKLIEAFRRQLIAERGSLSGYKWSSLSENRNPVVRGNLYSLLHRQRQRVVYVRANNGEILDVTVPIWDEWERRVPEWSQSLRELGNKITSQIWSGFPPPDPELVAKCKSSLPAK